MDVFPAWTKLGGKVGSTAPQEQPLRAELFSVEQLEAHAKSLAARHKITRRHPRVASPLLARLVENEAILRQYNIATASTGKKRPITPASDWLLDNFYLVKEHINLARLHLPRNYSRQLPCLAGGPSMGYPRVYDLVLELISHTDGRFDLEQLSVFVAAYQGAQELTLGELWAIPIMLRLALIDNIRRIAEGLAYARNHRDLANHWADRMVAIAEKNPSDLILVISDLARSNVPLTSAFVAEFWRRLQSQGASLQFVRHWLDQRLSDSGLGLEELIQSESQLQAADQVSIGNTITSLRALGATDWKEFVETLSLVEQILRGDPARVYGDMDFASRDHYRHAIENIARYGRLTEAEAARAAVALARKASGRENHVGFFLVDRGIALLEKEAEVKLPLGNLLRRGARHRPLLWYVAPICLITLGLTAWSLAPAYQSGLHGWRLAVFAVLPLLCLSHLAVSLINWLVTLFLPPRTLPRLDFSEGISSDCKTLVVVPTLLTNKLTIETLLERLEIHSLANRDDNLHFALLTDFADAPQAQMLTDEALLRQAREGIHALNEKYKSGRPNIFFLFHRGRQWNEREGVWMGWERKRGKLADLNHVLRGGSTERFSDIVGDLRLLQGIPYVITLDSDTQLPRESARQLVGTLAHPLNRPRFDAGKGRVCEGYGILQPRVAVSLPSASRSWFVRLFAGEAGIDPYTRAVSDVYQDLFEEGSFIGKGIYDVNAFEQAVGGKFPDNAILSHDLLESCHARSALVSDVQFYEEYPSRYITDVNRRHRWIRGDWQIAAWLLPRVPGQDAHRIANPLSGLSKWKIFDNLRRSLVPTALTLLIILNWLGNFGPRGYWTVFVVAIITAPGLLTALGGARKAEEMPWGIYLHGLAGALARQLGQALFTLVFLPYDAFVSIDAVLRTLCRMFLTHRRLLEWQTAHDSEARGRNDVQSFLRAMWVAPVLALAVGIKLGMHRDVELAYSGIILALWFFSPLIGWRISLPIRSRPPNLTEHQTMFLKKVSRKTWRFFEVFVTEEENWLPPDNFQEHPVAIVASRTSPTNIGLSLLSSLAACDFGYITPGQLLERVSRTFKTMDLMERHRGHFYNWYDTRSLKPLLPLYLSSVDSGNLAAHLLTLRQGLLEAPQQPIANCTGLRGLEHTAAVLAETVQRLAAETAQTPGLLAKVRAVDEKIGPALKNPPTSPAGLNELLGELLTLGEELSALALQTCQGELTWWTQAFEKTCRAQKQELELLTPWVTLPPLPDSLRRAAGTQHPRRLNELSGMLSFLQTFPSLRDAARFEQTLLPLAMLATEKIRAHRPDAPELAWMHELQRTVREASRHAGQRLNLVNRLAQRSAELGEMDFEFLFDKTRDLFAIGFNATDHRMDGSFYDLLASEARLTSYLAISQYQVKQDHWFALGRIVVSPRGAPALVSWSGSMFEYLMPLLVMPTYENTLLDNTYKAAVARQIAYGKECNIPWGFSESGFNLTDAHLNYQYRAFGVPGLGLKRGLSDDLVVAPYATVMALMVAPAAACANLERLAHEGREGPYGFYEAIDYTPARLRPGQLSAVVRSFMAHHQGMSLCSLAYLLLDRPMQRRFEANPLFKSADLLLQERVPKAISPLYPAELEVGGRPEVEQERKETLRVFTNPNAPLPEVHLLSNGRYHVMVSSSGASYSSWKDVSLTRWREDATRDCWGAFCYLRDVESGEVWSAAYQPTCRVSRLYEAIFTQGRAEFRRRTDELDIHTEISVSPQDDIELRRLTIANRSNRPRTIEVTTYTEVALNGQGPDLAHPAFSKLFVQTEILPEQKALLCTRRPRSDKEKPPWFFHFVLPPVHEVGEVSFETDRSKFLGRGRTAAAPAALDAPGPLSNSQGSVLDPAMAIRRTIKLAPDESIRIDSIYGAHENREGALNLLQKYRDSALAGRVLELAWTHSQVILHHLNASETDAQTFGRLASSIVYAHRFRRAGSRILQKNNRSQNNLWAYGIPGDLPMALILLTDVANIEFARKVVQAHAYWRMKGLSCDMVILTQDDSIYRQGLYEQVVGLVASSTEAQWLDKPGGIFVRHMEAIPEDDRILLQTVARLILSDEEGTLAEQADRRARPDPVIPQLIPSRMPEADKSAPAAPARPELQFNNGYGGFSKDGKEYVITLNAGQVTPAPWVNVLANPSFGSVISESGGSYTWAENAHEFRLTPWYNDPVSDTTGEAFYIRDEQTGQFWSPSPGPARGEQPYTVRHGFGYSVFSHRENEIESELTVFVARDVPLKFAWLKVRNLSTRVRRLSAIGYWEWVLGELRDKNLMHVITEVDPRSGALLARNPYNSDFSGRVAFADVQIATRQFTTDRGEFLGRNGSLANPAALHRLRLSGKVGGGWDPCAALQVIFDLGEGQERDIVFRIGVGRDGGEAQHLIQHFRGVEAARKTLDAVKQYWTRTVDAVQVETPEPAVDLLANGWLIYQVLASRMWARSGFYQSGGAFGFRDQLQDAMGLLHCESRLLREHLLRAAGHQFVEGDVQHWWHPPTDRGVRTHFSDDYLWLPYATCRYVLGLNDTGILDEIIPFLEGRPVKPEEEAYFDLPRRSGASGTLYEHCVRAINHGLRTGAHGLPLMGCGDWNDGMNLVGEHGKGESVWLAFFLYDVLTQFAEVARRRKDDSFAQHCLSQAAQLRVAIEQAWDGGWYRRAYFDDGTPLGSASNDECKMDSLPQSWAVISRAADPERARLGMDAADQHLVKRDSKVIQLFEPPFDKSALNPGYIKGYVPGVRENGGQYTHAAIWMIMAFAMMGDHKRAWELVTMILPQNHSRDLAAADVYKVEPYVAVADVYAVWPHIGRGGWTWYTGSAGWLYRLILEHLLGVKLEVDHLRFVPCLPPAWKSFAVRYRYRDTVYHITFQSQTAWLKVEQILVDGVAQPGGTLALVDDLKEHHAEVRFL